MNILQSLIKMNLNLEFFTKGDKSYILINFAPNLPIFEFLFDISVYKNYISKLT